MIKTLTFCQFMELQAKAYGLDKEFHGTRVEYDAAWDGNKIRVGCDKADPTATSWVLSNPIVAVGKSPLQEALFFNRSALSYLRAGLISTDGIQYKLLWRIPPVEKTLEKWQEDMKTYVALLARSRKIFKESPNLCEIYAH